MRRREPLRRLLIVVAVGAVCCTKQVAIAAPPWSGSIRNTGTAGTGALAFAQSYNSASCATPAGAITATSTKTISCAGRLWPSGTPRTTTDSVTNNSTLPSGSMTGSVAWGSCAPVGMTDVKDANDVMLPRWSTTLNGTSGAAGTSAAAAHPLAGGGSVTLNGTTDYLAQSTLYTNPLLVLVGGQSIGIWFKTTSTAGGGLYSFDGNPAVPAASDGTNQLSLYMTPGGKLGFEGNVAQSVGQSAAAYNDGQWHFAYANINLFGLFVTVAVYVDGNLTPVVSASGLTLLAAGGGTGYWHLGWSQDYGYWAGSESSFVLMNSNPVTSAFYTAGTQAAFDATAASWSATDEWRLADTAASTYNGSLPVVGATSPCAMVNVTWDGASVAVGGSASVTLPGGGTTAPSTLGVARGGTYNTSFCPGLQLYAPLSLNVTAGSAAQWSTSFGWSGTDATLVI